MEQRSIDWFTARCGHVTASRIADMMAKTKSGVSASRANYAAQLIAERLTGNVEQSYSNSAMQWGTETEPQARAAYEFLRDATVVECGFILHPTIAYAGASPDGLVAGESGLIEVKCPNTATHISTLRGAEIDRKYILQMQWQMACTERGWCDFVSYDPRLPIEMQTHVRRVQRDDALITEIQTELTTFLAEIDAAVAELDKTYRKAA